MSSTSERGQSQSEICETAPASVKPAPTNKIALVGWIISFLGSAIWIYGYFVTGEPALIDWHAMTPWWIADFLPNLESEIGMALVAVAMVPMYWPARR
jgi:hypothetical protein